MRLIISVLGIWYLQSKGFAFEGLTTLAGAFICIYAFILDLADHGSNTRSNGCYQPEIDELDEKSPPGREE
jgi:hypothetical protein